MSFSADTSEKLTHSSYWQVPVNQNDITNQMICSTKTVGIAYIRESFYPGQLREGVEIHVVGDQSHRPEILGAWYIWHGSC
jgi:hypothetical protein